METVRPKEMIPMKGAASAIVACDVCDGWVGYKAKTTKGKMNA